MPLLPAQFIISILLFLILFFGIGFLLNMLLKTTWFPGVLLYPIVVVLIVNDLNLSQYVASPLSSFAHLGLRFTELPLVDYVILFMGLVGALLSGVAIRMLRVRGYRMF
jgi:hypothetical protein